jgi:hypothetical protein
LSAHLASKLFEHGMYPTDGSSPRIRIKLEKPTAVVFADAPAIEIVVDDDPGKNVVGGSVGQ